MIENLNYISDDELEQLICQVEENELVTAPPDLMGSILEAVELVTRSEGLHGEVAPVISVKSYNVRKKEFYAYCFRVITSVAAAVVLVFLLPELTDRMSINGIHSQEQVNKWDVVGTVPVQEEVVKNVPDKATVVETKPTPSKEDVLNDTGFFEKVISGTVDWFNKDSTDR